jgi:ubiquinone/menaquinone biosynthesis C-methylase UbiE
MEKIKSTGMLGQVRFIPGTEKDIPTTGFDVVITNFYLDLFSQGILNRMVQRIVRVLKPSGLWMAADFVNTGKWWQVFLLKAMYLFFRRVCNIEALTLPPWGKVLTDAGLRRVERRLFYGGFIESVVFRALPGP